MKQFLLIVIALVFFLPNNLLCADKSTKDHIQRHSLINEDDDFFDKSSFPMPFSKVGQDPDKPVVSTGYYFVDNWDWDVNKRPELFDTDTSNDQSRWRRILPGPRLLPRSYWDNNPDEGLRFFRNPALPGGSRSFFDHGVSNATDSTDNAIAGPIPIGFDFYFNGISYDSFYVSTNGIIALTNRRYYYNSSGSRAIPWGKTSAYDIMSMDWFDDGRGRSGNGLSDGTEDDYGYKYSVCGGYPSIADGGIRTANTDSLSALQYKAAVIAPFWGDNHLSQFDADEAAVDDWGRCYFKKPVSGDKKLIIYIVNIAPKGQLDHRFETYFADPDLRPGDDNYISATAAILLNGEDSSITIQYDDFDGVAVVNGHGARSEDLFRFNTTAGVRGFARHKNYGSGGCGNEPWCGEYEQYTHYYSNYANSNESYPSTGLAVKFKQWKNLLRVADFHLRVRNLNPNSNLDYTEIVPSSKCMNMEFLAGEERLAAPQPVVIIQNLSNNIQGPGGVNYQGQQLRFRARCRIINEMTGRIVYNRLVPVDSTCLALPDSLSQDCTGDPYVTVRYVDVVETDSGLYSTGKAFPGPDNLNGIPPYGYLRVTFPPYEPSEFLDNHIGRMKMMFIVDPTDPDEGTILGDEWGDDDTLRNSVFYVRRLDEFNYTGEYYLDNRIPKPDPMKWVNIGAEVTNGEVISNYPHPPRGETSAINDENIFIESPVVRMNRFDFGGNDYSGREDDFGGDELRSFPIDMRNRYGSHLCISIKRSSEKKGMERDWCDNQLIGPEPRTIVNGDSYSLFGQHYQGTDYVYEEAVSRFYDKIAVEFMQPSPDGVNGITNVEDSRWRNHPRRGGLPPVTDAPAYELYGSNGSFRGFLEAYKDSSLSRESYSTGQLGGHRPDMYDDGIDDEFHRIFIGIPDTMISARNEGAKNFRFRIRVIASDDQKCDWCIPDDDDPFYIDNVQIMFPCECTDIEVLSVKAEWPYTITPPSQAREIPVKVKVSTTASSGAPTFWVRVRIFPKNQDRPVYCKTKQLPFLSALKPKIIDMPPWDATRGGPIEYRLVANIIMPGGDIISENDTTYSDFKVTFGDVMAYDPVDATNDVPYAFNLNGVGLNLRGYTSGGWGSIYGQTRDYDESRGFPGYLSSGQIAMKFELNQADTLYGFNAYFALRNTALDDIAFSLYTDREDSQPDEIIQSSLIYKQRGLDDIRMEPFFDEYTTYLFSEPILLPEGTYWAVVTQLGETGIELGASKMRMGMRTTNVYIPAPVNTIASVGRMGTSIILDKSLRKEDSTGKLKNNNIFVFENSLGGAAWEQFMPNSGNPAYAHLHHFGITPEDNKTATLSRGTWLPMIRPYFGEQTWADTIIYEDCPEIPVEMVSFTGNVRDAGIELNWVTASEKDNLGFYIERRLPDENSTDWGTVSFVKGTGTSVTRHYYSWLDTDVKINTKYEYRLRQVDIDGSQSCTFKETVVLTFGNAIELAIEECRPNPFSSRTMISFTIPEENHAKLEIWDLKGQLVNTLVDGNLPAQIHNIEWDGSDASGIVVPSGTYLCRLVCGTETRTRIVTLVR